MAGTTEFREPKWRRIASRRFGWALKLLVVAAVLAMLVYWIRLSPVRVHAHRIERGTVVAEVTGTGTLEARVQATVSPKIAGRIEDIHVDQGDRVSVGQTLLRLDDAELRQQVEVAEAGLEAAQAAVDRIKTDRERAVAVLEQARKEHDRTRTLATRDAATTQSLDRAAEALAIAQAGLAQSDAAVTEAEKEAIAAAKTLGYHRARLDDTEVKAPFDGLIVARRRDPGDVVVPGSPVLALISTDELWVTAWVDETAIDELAEGQSARVVFRSEPGRTYSGSVARIGRETDRETREFIADVRVLELPKNWAVGQRAEVFVETIRKEDAILIPAEAISLRDGKHGVYVDADGRVEWRPVQLGLRNRSVVEAVSGLEPGQVAITSADSHVPLTDGRRIDFR